MMEEEKIVRMVKVANYTLHERRRIALRAEELFAEGKRFKVPPLECPDCGSEAGCRLIQEASWSAPLYKCTHYCDECGNQFDNEIEWDEKYFE